MEPPTSNGTAHITIVDLLEFKSAIAASSSLSNARLLGFGVDGIIDLPSFHIEVDQTEEVGYISGTTESENYYKNVIIYFFGDDGRCHYALASSSDTEDWVFNPTVVIDEYDGSPQFSELPMSEQLKQLGV